VWDLQEDLLKALRQGILAVCSETAAQKNERPHPPTISKRPAKLRYLRQLRFPRRIGYVQSSLAGPPPQASSTRPSLRFHPPYACGTFGLWFAGAGFYLSVGRRLLVV
jgi:hypothetical protein